MKLKNYLFFAAAALAVSFLFTNCASLTGFQTGRTVGQENGELLISINASQTPEFDFDGNDTTDVDNFYFPNLEVSGRYGIIEKLDIGLRVNTNFNLAFDAKYQVIGDRYSPVAVAVGGGVGTFGLFAALWNVQIPVYFSIHPSEMVDIYITPRYIAQFAAGDFSGSLSYLGGNAGIMFGKRTKFGIDAGLYNVSAVNQDLLPILTFGIGAKIPFGNN
jgi:hypothetical protein